MMAKLHGRRNNVLAGTLVILAIVGATFAIILLGGALDVLGKRQYMVRFPLDIGVGGLVEGSAVQVGGLEVGAVREVRPVVDDGAFTGFIDVEIAVDDRVVFRHGAEALLQKPLVGGLSSINFMGLGESAAAVVEPDEIIPGRIAPPEILASAGYGEAQAQALRALIDAAAEGAENFRAISSSLRDSTLPRIDRLTERVDADYPLWSQNVTSTLESVNATAERAPDIADGVRDAIETVRTNAGRATDAIVSNGAAFERTLAEMTAFLDQLEQSRRSAEGFLRQLDEDVAPRATAFLDESREAVEDAGAALERAQSIMGEQSPQIRRSLANFRIASQELRFMTAEVRRSPWRLLYRPDARELEYELLYESARTYAAAVTNLRAATESLEAVISADNPRLAAEGADLAQLKAEVVRAFENYETAQRRFMDELMEETAE